MFRPIFTFLLLFLSLFLFSLDQKEANRGLTFAMLDVGQGDAFFIESPTGTQILIDGGPPRKILGELAKVMPSFDRTLDAVFLTHPDTDHIGGLLDVFSFYQVGQVFEPGIATDSEVYKNLKQKLEEKKMPSLLARKGMRLHLGGGAVLDVLFPDQDVSDWENNMASVVTRLSFGETSFLLTGDATFETEKMILAITPKEFLKSDFLKAGHHGSKTSTSLEFVKAVSPIYGLISAGRNNSYGHPHEEVLEVLKNTGAKILRTDLLGTILIKIPSR